MSELVGYTGMACTADAFVELARILALSKSQLRKQLEHQQESAGWWVHPPGAEWERRDETIARTTKRSPGGSRSERRANLARVRHLAPHIQTPFQEKLAELRQMPPVPQLASERAPYRKLMNTRKRARRAA